MLNLHQPDFEFLQEKMFEILRLIDADPDRAGLEETPERVSRAWITELFAGIHQSPDDHLKTFEEVDTSDLVIVTNIPVYSTCEHHLEPIFGFAHIAYIPDGKVLGLSKFARIVDVFARRLQIQERLTTQVADTLFEGLNPQGLLVTIEARHFCMERRGVQAAGTITITSAIRGSFEDDLGARQEALGLIRSAKKPVI